MKILELIEELFNQYKKVGNRDVCVLEIGSADQLKLTDISSVKFIGTKRTSIIYVSTPHMDTIMSETANCETKPI